MAKKNSKLIDKITNTVMVWVGEKEPSDRIRLCGNKFEVMKGVRQFMIPAHQLEDQLARDSNLYQIGKPFMAKGLDGDNLDDVGKGK